jgi:hypothetical protein
MAVANQTKAGPDCYDPERSAPLARLEMHRCGPPLPPVMRSPESDDNTP